MNCPICNREMKSGEIHARSGGGLFWFPDEEKVNFIVSNDIIKKHSGIVIVDSNEIKISYPAYVCSKCRKIVMDY